VYGNILATKVIQGRMVRLAGIHESGQDGCKAPDAWR
jgi:hypothetical protein